MLEIRPLTQEDLDFVRQNPFESAVKVYPYLPAPDNNCYTIIFEDEIVAVGGLIILWEGVGELWLMLTKNSRKQGIYGLISLTAIEKKINELINDNNLWRAQAMIRTDFPQAIKMIEALGFEKEGILRRYCPDKGDSFLYSRIV